MAVVKTRLHIGFDAKGQVIRDDHSTDNAKDRAFEFDGIGNRTKSADSLTLPASNNYVANALNQYSTALGVARPVASHDDDGNLINDGTKTYVWDGENRLLSVSDSSGVLASYTYDYLSRRISKDETNGSNVTFVYDGWNPVAVYGGSGLSKTYTWGMDLSGSMQGAGGVGGLLAVKEGSNSYYPTYDGNGNVSEYLDSTGAVVAHYEYDAFGRTTVSSGVKKDDFVHRFSTKQWDAVGLYYYGYRYYQPEIGRWLGRDPIEEGGGFNIYGFLGNNGANYIDQLGLAWPRAEHPEHHPTKPSPKGKSFREQLFDLYRSSLQGIESKLNLDSLFGSLVAEDHYLRYGSCSKDDVGKEMSQFTTTFTQTISLPDWSRGIGLKFNKHGSRYQRLLELHVSNAKSVFTLEAEETATCCCTKDENTGKLRYDYWLSSIDITKADAKIHYDWKLVLPPAFDLEIGEGSETIDVGSISSLVGKSVKFKNPCTK